MQEGEQGAELDRLTTPAEIEQAAIVRMAGFLGVSRCYFAHIEDGRTATVQHEYRGEGISESLLIAEHPLKEYISPEDMELFLRGETLVVDDVLEDPRTSSFAANFARIQMRAFVSTPGLIGGEWFGIFVVGSESARVWREDELELVREVAARVYPVIERARAEWELCASEERYRTLFESIDEGFCIVEVIFEDGKPVDYRFLEVILPRKKRGSLPTLATQRASRQ